MKRRRMRWFAAAAVAAVLLVLLAWQAAGLLQPHAPLIGTELEPPRQAVDFSLVDQRGKTFRLSDARGKVVVLTLLYTSCTDVCPFVGVKLRRARQMLGEKAEGVEFVAITTDPERDSVDRNANYSRELGMMDGWHYLTGTREQLGPVWEGYLVRPARGDDRAERLSDQVLREYGLFRGLNDSAVEDAKDVIEEYGGGYDVSHSAPVWLIDRKGQLRAFHRQDLLPSELVHDVELLLEAR